jgi:hypothetical protein
MSQPTQYSVHIDAILTNISVAYMQMQNNFVATRVFPIVPVDKQSNKLLMYPKNDWFRDEAQVRADATESAGGGYNLSTDSYSAAVWAFHKDIGDQTRANADMPINLDREATEFVTGRILLRQEIDWQSKFFTTGVWGTDISGVSSSPSAGTSVYQWSDYTNSDPLEDIEAGKEAILGTTGFMPNTLVLGYQVFRKLKNHPDLVDRIKYTSSDVITEDMMARMFGVERVLVTKGVKATNKEGGTSAYGFIHGKAAMLCYSAPSAGLLQPSAGYTFAWTGVSNGLGQSIGTSRFRMDSLKSDRIEAEAAWDNKVVASDLGYFFSTVVA